MSADTYTLATLLGLGVLCAVVVGLAVVLYAAVMKWRARA